MSQPQGEHKVPGVLEQKIFASKDPAVVEYSTNEFILKCTKTKFQITNISHMSWNDKLAVVISYLRPLTADEMPAEEEVTEL